MDEWALPEINLELCDRCGQCIAMCPNSAVEMGPRGPFFIKPEECTFCASCESICPHGAITCAYEVIWQEGNGGSG